MKVFLSYHHTTLDEGIAEFLFRALSSEGFEVFFDRELRVGETWSKEIQGQLEDSGAVIVLLSRESAARPMVQREVSTAFEISDRRPMEILPVRIAGAEIPAKLARLGRVQYRAWDVGEELSALAADLAEALKRAEQRRAPTAAGEAAAEDEAGTPDAEDSEIAAYTTWAGERHRGLHLIGVGGGDVRLALEEVYVPLRISRRALVDFEGRRGKRRGELAWEHAEADVELEQIFTVGGAGPHAAVFGEPGAGKTTALKKLHQSCLSPGAESLGLAAGTIPVFLPLRRLAGQDLSEPLSALAGKILAEASGGEIAEDLGDRLWHRGRLLLLLDGLDEIAGDARRAEVASYLDWQLAAAPARQARAVVSCRYAGYGGKVRLGDRFLPLDVRPLDAGQVGRLVQLWFREAQKATRAFSAAEARRRAADLVEALEGEGYASQQLKVLVSSPLLLTLLCVIVLRGGEMPRQRVEFYDQCLRVLLGRWGKLTKGQEPLLDIESALAVLRPLAWRLHEQQRRDDLSGVELANHVRKRLRDLGQAASPFRVAEWLHRETGVIEEYAPQRYGFMHLGLQEYLAAAHAASRGEELLDRLAGAFGERWWREVILLLVGLPGRQVFGPFMERVLRTQALGSHGDLLRQCLIEAPEVDLEPFLEALEGERDATRQAALLRLLRGRCDPRLLARAASLESSSAADVAALARRIGEECRTSAAGASSPGCDLLLLYSAEESSAAGELAASLEGRGVRLFASRDWESQIESLLASAHAVAALVGPEGGAPWQRPELAACLELFAGEDRPLVPVLLPGAVERPELPASVDWAPWVDLSGGIAAAGCEALEHASLRAEAPAAVSLSVEEGPEPGQLLREPLTGMGLLWIPGGRFEMGGEAYADEQPVHWVRVSPFWLGETPVTNRQYGVFLEQTGGKEPEYWRDRRFSGPDQPVVGVSWHDATAFCQWLSQALGLAVDLPTEAQWEFAARGSDGREYPWGSEDPDSSRACFDLDYRKGQPAQVGSFPAGKGPFGTHDQAGNVWEWCRDVWAEDAYQKRSESELLDPITKEGDESVRVLRGGGWSNPAVGLRAASRSRYSASFRLDDVGFRVSAAPASP